MLAAVEQNDNDDWWWVGGWPHPVPSPLLLISWVPSPLSILISAVCPLGLAVLSLEAEAWTPVRTFLDPLGVAGAGWERQVHLSPGYRSLSLMFLNLESSLFILLPKLCVRQRFIQTHNNPFVINPKSSFLFSLHCLQFLGSALVLRFPLTCFLRCIPCKNLTA